jgi:hypothetical protein
MLTRNLVLLALSMLFTACTINGTSSGNLAASQIYQGECELSGGAGGNGIPICEDFLVNSPSNDSSCTAELTRYNSLAPSAFYIAPSGLDTSCPLTGTGVSLIGNCTLIDRIIRYYGPAWTTAPAQSDCTSRSGVWANPS